MNNDLKYKILPRLLNELANLSWQERLLHLKKYHDKKIIFSTSFGYEDQAITHVIGTNNLPIEIFTLDTGRLFEETYKTFELTTKAYPQLAIKTYYPQAEPLQALIQKQGINGFYESVEKRQACCYVRKVEGLKRALKGSDLWISGLRRQQSQDRSNLPIAEYDDGLNVIKVYPLIDVLLDDLVTYVVANKIPYNTLHDKGFISIGCSPCTRAVKSGDRFRSERWWWEQDTKKECGLHVKDGKLVRTMVSVDD